MLQTTVITNEPLRSRHIHNLAPGCSLVFKTTRASAFEAARQLALRARRSTGPYALSISSSIVDQTIIITRAKTNDNKRTNRKTD